MLEAVTLIYLGCHVLVFLAGWVRPAMSIPLMFAWVLFATYTSARAMRWAGTVKLDAWLPGESLRRPAILIGLVAATVACTGVGGLTFQFFDYYMYDIVYKMLVHYPLPSAYRYFIDDVPMSLLPVYYWAYFLPSAVVGKLLGWDAGYLFQYFWNCLGVLITMAWFLRILGVFQIRYALLFVGFAGLDIIGYLVTTPLPDGEFLTWWDYFAGTFWWSTGPGWMAHWTANYSLLTPEGAAVSGGVFYRFYGPLSFLFDGPIHVLPAWIIIVVCLHDALRRRTVERAYFLTAMLPLCSVFVTVGAVPFLAMATWHARFRGLFSIGNVVIGPVLVLIFMLYYGSVQSDIVSGFLWEFQRLPETWLYLALYYATAFLIYAFVAPSMRGDGYRPGRVWFYGSLVVFILAPWYRMGVFNDFTTKVVIPSQIVFLVCLATAIRSPEGRYAILRQRVLVGLLIVGGWSATGIIHRAVTFGFSVSPTPYERVPYAPEEMAVRKADQLLFFDEDNFFWRYIARPLNWQYEVPENPTSYLIDFTQEREGIREMFFVDEVWQTEEGVVVRTPSHKPIVRLSGLDMDTRQIGHVVLDHTVTNAKGDVPDYRLTFNWVDARNAARRGSYWPFHRWEAAVLWPEEARITANPYWRGTVAELAIYFEAEGPDDAEYIVTVRELRFTLR